MNVSRITPGSSAATGAASPEAAESDPRVRALRAPAPTTSAGRGDRFEMSEAARAHQAEVAEHHAEVESARAALRAEGDLTPERVARLQQRVEEGFYDRPEVVATVAERAAADLRASEG